MSLNLPNLQGLGSNMSKDVAPSMGPVLRAQDKLNSDINQALTDLTSFNWQYPQLTNGWVNFSTTLRVRYTVIAGPIVVLSGSAKSGTIPASIFNLPQGLWPTQDCNFSVNSNALYGSLVVNTQGQVVAQTGDATIFSLDGCMFLAEQ